MANANEGYTFQLMDIPDLIEAFRGIGLQEISETDFKDPKRESWKFLYLQLLKQCFENEMENFGNPSIFSSDCGIEDIHENSIFDIHLIKAMQTLMSQVSGPDFEAVDVYNPRPKRLQRICSAVVNFMRYKDEFLSNAEAKKTEYEQKAEKIRSLKQSKEALVQKIAALKEKKLNTDSQLKTIEQQSAYAAQEIKACKITSADLIKQVREQHAILAEKEALYLEHQLRRKNLEARDVQQNQLHIDEQEKEVNALSECFKALAKEASSHKEAVAERSSLQTRAHDSKEELLSLNEENKLSDAKTREIEEKLQRQTLQMESKLKNVKKNLEENDTMLKTLENSTDDQSSETAKLHRERQELRLLQEEGKTEHEASMARLLDTKEKLLSAVDVYHKNLASICGPRISALKERNN